MPKLQANGGYLPLKKYDGPPIPREEYENLTYTTYSTDDQTTFAPLLRFYVKQTADHDSATFLSGMVACYVATFVPGARHSLAPVIAWR